MLPVPCKSFQKYFMILQANTCTYTHMFIFLCAFTQMVKGHDIPYFVPCLIHLAIHAYQHFQLQLHCYFMYILQIFIIQPVPGDRCSGSFQRYYKHYCDENLTYISIHLCISVSGRQIPRKELWSPNLESFQVFLLPLSGFP